MAGGWLAATWARVAQKDPLQPTRLPKVPRMGTAAMIRGQCTFFTREVIPEHRSFGGIRFTDKYKR